MPGSTAEFDSLELLIVEREDDFAPRCDEHFSRAAGTVFAVGCRE